MDNNIVYALFHSSPDYSANSPVLLSLHETFEDAVATSFEKDPDKWRLVARSKVDNAEYWSGPDGFGLIRKMQITNNKAQKEELLKERRELLNRIYRAINPQSSTYVSNSDLIYLNQLFMKLTQEVETHNKKSRELGIA